jgi:hypothetical protein
VLYGRYIKILLLVALACCSNAAAQQRNLPSRPGTAQGELTVTLTIVSSVGVVMEEHGQPRVIVANAADPADNVSALRVFPLTSQPQQKPKNKKKK